MVRKTQKAWGLGGIVALLVLIGTGCVQAQTNVPEAGELATEAVLQSPSGLALDTAGNLYIAERGGHRIRKVNLQTGRITTVVGTGTSGYAGDGGPATDARISIPELIAFDAADNLYVTDRGNSRIRKVDAGTGIITTVVGTGTSGYAGDGGPATEALISAPFGLGFDPEGHLFIADTDNHVIRRIDAQTGIITTVAGTGVGGFSGDGGPATAAQFSRPHNFTFDPQGHLVIGDSQNQRIRRVDRHTGHVTTLYGSGERGVSPDGIPAREAAFFFFGAMLTAPDGDLVFTGWVDSRIRRIDPETGIVTTLAGTGTAGASEDGLLATEAPLNSPYGLAIDAAGNLYVVEADSHRVRRIDAKTGRLSTVAGRAESE